MFCKSIKGNFLSILVLSLALVLFFNASALAGSELKCNGELPGGYTFSGPDSPPARKTRNFSLFAFVVISPVFSSLYG